MHIDIQNLSEDGQVLDRVVPRASVCLEDDTFAFASDLELSGRIQPTSDGSEAAERAFRLTGALKGRLDVVCARCLTHFGADLDERLDLLYLPQAENAASSTGAGPGARGSDPPSGGQPEADAEGRALGDEELAVAFYRDEEIDLGQMIFEQTLLSLPMKPLCRPDCAGLCATCGANRNETPCECSEQETDPRWDGLKALLG